MDLCGYTALKAIALSTVVALSSCGGGATTQSGSTTSGGGFSTPTEPMTKPMDDMKGMDDMTMPEVEMPSMEDEAKMKAEMLMAQIQDHMTVFFLFDQSTVTAVARESLDLHAKYLSMNPMQQIVLEGHADERGTPEYNLGLSERRANAVAAYLRLQGVNQGQISVVAMGEEMPADFGQTEAAYGKNRRVEVKYQ